MEGNDAFGSTWLEERNKGKHEILQWQSGSAIVSGWWPEVGIRVGRAGPGNWGTPLSGVQDLPQVGAAAAATAHLLQLKTMFAWNITHGNIWTIKLSVGFSLHYLVIFTKLN